MNDGRCRDGAAGRRPTIRKPAGGIRKNLLPMEGASELRHPAGQAGPNRVLRLGRVRTRTPLNPDAGTEQEPEGRAWGLHGPIEVKRSWKPVFPTREPPGRGPPPLRSPQSVPGPHRRSRRDQSRNPPRIGMHPPTSGAGARATRGSTPPCCRSTPRRTTPAPPGRARPKDGHRERVGVAKRLQNTGWRFALASKG